MTTRERTHARFHQRRVAGWLAVAGMLAIAGCSAHPSNVAVATGHHDDGIRLAPDPATSASRIAVVLSDTHVMPSQCRYEWRRNDMTITEATGDGLEPGNFTKGDQVAVVVTISDPAGGAPRVLHADVTVGNSPPKVMAVECVIAAGASPMAEARTQAVDPDGDAMTYSYRWFKNGKLVDGATSATLPLEHVGRGDQVIAEVVANDGTSASTPVKSPSMVVENRPPQFTSTPGAPQQTDATYHYQAQATDPDGDKLHYELVSGPLGMSVSAEGDVSWPIPQGDQHQGDFQVKIRALDPNGGEASQDFVLHLDAPTVQTTTTRVRTTSAGINMNGDASAQPAGAAPQPTWHVIRHSYFSGDSAGH